MKKQMWDGSPLHYDEIEDLGVRENIGRYVTVIEEKNNYYGHLTESETYSQIILDEMKPLFGLQKVGTRRINIGSRKYVLKRILYDDNFIYIDDDYDPDDYFEPSTLSTISEEFINHLIFRYVFDLFPVGYKSFRVRENHIIAWREPSSFSFKKENIRRWELFDKYLSDINISERLSYMCPLSAIQLRWKVEEIVKRVDNSLCPYISNMIANYNNFAIKK